MPLTTDWLTIGTAGPTVDGRKISDQMLLDAAETYDPDEYEAVISSDHLLWWYGNFGRVAKVRSNTDKKGRTVLQAKIQPNKRLIEMNIDGQRLHTSMELTDDFAGTGKAYLMGLAVTDEPASLGTSQLQFSQKSPCPVLISQQTESIQLTDLGQKSDQDSDPKCEESFFQWFKQRLNKELRKPSDPPEDDDMTEEQFKTLKDLGEQQVDAVEKLNGILEDKFANATFATKKETPETGKKPTDEAAGENKVLEAIEKLSTRLTQVETQVSKAVEGKPATEKPAGTGAGKSTAFV